MCKQSHDHTESYFHSCLDSDSSAFSNIFPIFLPVDVAAGEPITCMHDSLLLFLFPMLNIHAFGECVKLQIKKIPSHSKPIEDFL